jgi:hypothetical protein
VGTAGFTDAGTAGFAGAGTGGFAAGAGTLGFGGVGTPFAGVGSFGIDGTEIGGGFGAPDAALAGSTTFALQLLQDTNLAPTGTSASAMRFTVPHAAQVASIIERR